MMIRCGAILFSVLLKLMRVCVCVCCFVGGFGGCVGGIVCLLKFRMSLTHGVILFCCMRWCCYDRACNAFWNCLCCWKYVGLGWGCDIIVVCWCCLTCVLCSCFESCVVLVRIKKFEQHVVDCWCD